MRAFVFLIAMIAGVLSAADLVETVSLLPEECRHRVVQQLSLAENNKDELLDAIQKSKPEYRGALGFLLANMPERDLTSLKGDFLLSNLEYAFKARNETAWAKAIPEELFFNDVMPYVNINERRDNWRKDFYERFMPLVKDCKTADEAIQILNKQVFATTKVSYHATKRPKPDQSPYESIEAGYASCTGLSIMLVDACRAVGIPARVAGIPLWADESGNHTWAEVWDNCWHFVGACEPAKLDNTWFFGKAAKTNLEKPQHHIYAASFKQTKISYPLVWDKTIQYVPAVDVSYFYTNRKAATFRIVDSAGNPSKGTLTARLNGVVVAHAAAEPEVQLTLASGQKYEVNVDGGKAQMIELGADKDQKFDVVK